ncbi:MAG TPA: hypothetical protein VNJ12_03300 [Candidatus Dormibacteraeota bacterium]|nr:hypothetical protein [Candidatus Dormibacteraeota bacterium]
MRRRPHPRFPRAIAAAVRLLVREESGQDLVEYSLLLTLVSLGVIASVDHLGDELLKAFLRIARAVVTQRVDFN